MALTLSVLTLVSFLPILSNDFVGYDDDVYVTENQHVVKGLNWENVVWAFRSFECQNWHPVTWLSHMLDCQIFGLRATGHHLTNLVIHIVNVLLVFAIFQRATKAKMRSFLVAALFGIHPLRVESVAWVAERKDVLSMLFFLLTILAYVEYVQNKSRPDCGRVVLWYCVALLLFLGGLTSKPMTVSLPFALLLFDYWPLERFKQPPSEQATVDRTPSISSLVRRLWSLILEKGPFLILAAASGWVTFIAQRKGGAMVATSSLSWTFRVENAVVSYWRYIGKLFWPTNLAVFYPHPGGWPTATVVLAATFLLGVTIILAAERNRGPYVVFGWFWFLGTLLPVIGLLQVGLQSMADRYSYIPSIGLFVAVVWGVADIVGLAKFNLIAVSLFCTGIIGSCLFLTRHQADFWRNDKTLFQHAMAVTEKNHVAAFHLGAVALFKEGKLDDAIKFNREAISFRPSYADAHNYLGVALYRSGKVDEAISELQTALRLDPGFAEAHGNLGNALRMRGQIAEAIKQYESAISLRPDSIEARQNLGMALCQQGRFDKGAAQFAELVRLQPDSAEAHFYLGAALAAAGNKDEAVMQLKQAIKLRPSYPEAERQLQALK